MVDLSIEYGSYGDMRIMRHAVFHFQIIAASTK
jgi:hypothetical protein